MENICKPCKPKKLCQEETCKKSAGFNFKGKNKLYCSDHKQEGMVDVNHKTCLECDSRAYYNIKGKQPIYCALHKKEDMIFINNKICQEPNCEKSASFNFKGKRPIYCGLHKKENMICIKVKLCIENNCSRQPCFNIKNEKSAIYCSEHKKENMFDIKHKICIKEECNNQASFNFQNIKTPIFCAQHKQDNMFDIKHKKCKTQHCDTYGNKKYEGYCVFCFINTFPDKPVVRNYKTKEKVVSDYIKEQFPEVTLITDKILEGGCSKRRPDILLDLGYQVIIIEIDENQHEDYQQICENKRTMEISQDLGHRPVIFIRFNPDAYKTSQGNVTSCWGSNKMGIFTVKNSKQKEWNIRLETLKETIKFWLNNQTQKTIETVYLFYDTLN